MAAPSIAGTTTADVQDALNSSGAATSQAISLPTSHTTNDILLLVVAQKNSGTGVISSITTTGTAWTQKSTAQASALALADVWWVRDGGSEPASVTVNWSVGGRASLKMVRITGAKTSGDPFDVFGSWSAAGGATTQVAPSITTTQADTLLISAVIAQVGTTGAVGADAAMRELGAEVISNAASSGAVVDLADETRASSGATGTRTWTFGASSNGAAVLFAIAPVAGGATQNAAAAQTATATQAATGASTKPVDAAQSSTATQAAAAASTKPVTASQTVTATQAAAASVTPAGKSIDAAQSVTGTQAAAAATTKPVAASQSVVATQAATATVTTTQSATATQALTVTQAATASVVSAVANRFYFVPPRRTRQVVADVRTGLLFEESYGMTVINTSGSYRLVEQPTQRELIDADAYYLGGHRTEITADEKSALETAGYSSGIETV